MEKLIAACRKLTDQLTQYDGFTEAAKPHEDDILVRYSAGSEVEQHIPAKFDGFNVRKSPYQTAYSPGFPSYGA